jgi:hypothetical protein
VPFELAMPRHRAQAHCSWTTSRATYLLVSRCSNVSNQPWSYCFFRIMGTMIGWLLNLCRNCFFHCNTICTCSWSIAVDCCGGWYRCFIKQRYAPNTLFVYVCANPSYCSLVVGSVPESYTRFLHM